MKYKNIRPHLFLLALAILVFAMASTCNGQSVITVDDGVSVKYDERSFSDPEGGGFLESDVNHLVALKVHSLPLRDGWVGTAFWLTDRVLLTCHHNIRDMKSSHKISIHTIGGDTYKSISVISSDRERDIALLSVNDLNVKPHSVVSVSSSTGYSGKLRYQGFNPKIDALFQCTGSPNDVKLGSATGQPWFSTGKGSVIQGMSGGPVIDINGQVVGVITGKTEQYVVFTTLESTQKFVDSIR